MKLFLSCLVVLLCLQPFLWQRPWPSQHLSSGQGALASEMLKACGLVRRLAQAEPDLLGRAQLAHVFREACDGEKTAENDLERALVARLDSLDCALRPKRNETGDILVYLTRGECLLVPGESSARAFTPSNTFQALSGLGACGLFLLKDLETRLSPELWQSVRLEAEPGHVALFSKRTERCL
ncbi:MAG: hypothetical protein K6G15_08680 [Desulfovibrio sp.]|nr:hypothetical protein [Desulfovibrio sp.]